MQKLEVSIDYLSKLAGMTNDDFLSLIQNEDGELIEDYESQVSDKIHKKILEIRDDQRKRGAKDASKKVTAFLDKHDISDYETIEDAFEVITEKLKAANAAEGKGQADKLTLEEIRQLPEVQNWFQSEVKALQTAKSELETKLTEAQRNFHGYKVQNIAQAKAQAALEKAKATGLNPKAVNMYLKALGTENLDIQQDGSITVLDNEGQPLKDELHNPVAFEDYVVKNWAFGFSEAPSGSKSPNHKPSGKGGKAKIVFRDEAHFNEELKKAGSDMKRISEITEAYADSLDG